MRKIIMICDRCGKQYNPWETKGTELYGIAEIDYSDFKPMLDMKMDLCKPCYFSLEKWWKDPEIIDEDKKWWKDPEIIDEDKEKRSFAW